MVSLLYKEWFESVYHGAKRSTVLNACFFKTCISSQLIEDEIAMATVTKKIKNSPQFPWCLIESTCT